MKHSGYLPLIAELFLFIGCSEDGNDNTTLVSSNTLHEDESLDTISNDSGSATEEESQDTTSVDSDPVPKNENNDKMIFNIEKELPDIESQSYYEKLEFFSNDGLLIENT